MIRVREIVKAAIAVVVVGAGVYLLFPRFGNHARCKSSVPSTAAQSAALEDARVRTRADCSASKFSCLFEIYVDSYSTFLIRRYTVENDFFEGCVVRDNDENVLVYDRDGHFVRTEVSPFAL